MARAPKPTRQSRAAWPAESVRLRPIGELLPHARNARKHSKEDVDALVAVMLEFGWTMPVLVDEAGTLIAGHRRLLAAQALVKRGHAQFGEAPTIVATGWTEPQKRAYLLADNKLTLNGTWDEDLLAAELADLDSADFDLALTGFSGDEIGRLIGDDHAKEATIRRVPVDEVSDRFWIVIRGPLKSQALALQALRTATKAIEGVEVEMGTVADEH